MLKEERRLDDCDSKPFKGPRPHGAKISMKDSIENGSGFNYYIKSIQVIQNQESSLSQQTCKTWRTTNAKVKANKGHPETADSFWRTSRKEIGAWLASDGSSWGAIWHVHIIHSHPTAIHLPCPDLEISKKKRRSCPTKLGQRSLGLRNLTSKHCTNTADLKSWFL